MTNDEQINRWFKDVQHKLSIYKQKLNKESTWKKYRNRKKGKLFRLRKKLKRLNYRLNGLIKEPTGQNKQKIAELNEIISRTQNELKQVKQSLKCLNLIKKEFSTNKLKQEIESIKSKQRSDEEEFKKWKQNLIRTMFGPREIKLKKLNKEQRRTRNYYRSASINLDNLIRIRSLWDNYLDSQNGTSIPQTYVLTDFQPNEKWKKYLGKFNLKINYNYKFEIYKF